MYVTQVISSVITKSEVVIPLIKDEKYGVLDIDSAVYSRSLEDEILEKAVLLLINILIMKNNLLKELL